MAPWRSFTVVVSQLKKKEKIRHKAHAVHHTSKTSFALLKKCIASSQNHSFLQTNTDGDKREDAPSHFKRQLFHHQNANIHEKFFNQACLTPTITKDKKQVLTTSINPYKTNTCQRKTNTVEHLMI